MSNRYAARRAKLLKIVQREKVDALLVTCEANVSYLTGFSGDSSYLLIGPEHERIISDFRYVTQLEEECPGLETYIRPTDVKLPEATVKVLRRRDGHTWLLPRNSAFEPILGDEAVVLGKVVAVLRAV